ncbi:PRP38 family-domain-containing protein [Cladochytrium replicatum]|nr:PRP38 family-domain-containing protein [Cladochytrium replicatum]
MPRMKKIETFGNASTMNMNMILFQNISNSPYFKQLYEKKTYHEVVDEIFSFVTSLEPFMKGTTASTAFCLLYKLWTLKLTVKQIYGLLTHADSPHLRGLGLLYLRYVCKPADLWDWYEPFLDDEEEVQVEGGVKPRTITIGRMARDLLTEQKWIGTILPRIPVPVARSIAEKLKERIWHPPGTGGGSRNFNADGDGEEDEDDEYIVENPIRFVNGIPQVPAGDPPVPKRSRSPPAAASRGANDRTRDRDDDDRRRGGDLGDDRRGKYDDRRDDDPRDHRRDYDDRRRRSRSPYRRRSRSPGGRRSRSPGGRRPRSPATRRSRSPTSRYSRSPARHSRSTGLSRSPPRHGGNSFRSPPRRRG